MLFGRKRSALHLFNNVKSVFSRKIQSALFVDFGNDNLNGVADRNDVFNLCNALLVELRNVNETFLAGSDLNKRAEVHDSGNGAVEDLAGLGILDDGIDEMHSHIAGIRYDSTNPGFKHFEIRPAFPEGLEWAKADYHSVSGYIATSWRRLGDKVIMQVLVPLNTTATLYADQEYEINGTGKPITVTFELK